MAEASPLESGENVYQTARTDYVTAAIAWVAALVWIGFRLWLHLHGPLFGGAGRDLPDVVGVRLLDWLFTVGLIAGAGYALYNARNAAVQVSPTEIRVRDWRRRFTLAVPWDNVAGIVWTEDSGAESLVFHYLLSLLLETTDGERRVTIARSLYYLPKELVQLRDDLLAAHAGHWRVEERKLSFPGHGKTITWRRED
jgi:hypothetical protein